MDQLVSHLFRKEAAKMTSVLVRMLGTENITAAEDIVQDTLIKAMETWPFYGIPESPEGWLYRVARNKAIDFLRNQKVQIKYENEFKHSESDPYLDPFEESEIKDSVLRMMFACCHPSIPPESQIALTLKTLGGLSTFEIAKAFFTSEETIAKRIYRAKEKIREENIQLVALGIFDLTQRLNNVLKVLYLIFNEGYYSTKGNEIIREDLCEEAMRLTFQLMQHQVTQLPKVKALLSLMCLQASRLSARTNSIGNIVLLEDQDRTQWNRPLIQKGLALLEEASSGNEVSDYHIEAAIASIHSLAPDFKSTQWSKLIDLYNILYKRLPSPMTALSRAIAIGYGYSPKKGLEEIIQIDSLKQNYFYYSALGNFYYLNHEPKQAAENYNRAIELAPTAVEKDMLKGKLLHCWEPRL